MHVMRKHHCGKCGLPVYFAEMVQAAGNYWHSYCFRCANPECGKYMDSRSYNDHKEKLYCNRCYKYLFGPKGVGYGVGAGVLLTATVSSGSSKKQTSSKADDIATASFLYTDEKKTQKPGYIERVDETFCDKKDLQCGSLLSSDH
ncbi:unnamed protein product [Gongylonema pulchrum]|uniref:Cysteine-rich protein 1 n=1 Tax=Gongylonema pulchrum TaxID=637853 RepID=A0A183DYX0_9BILA|nr:unnamed protein product [Gongylonema pulchrum]